MPPMGQNGYKGLYQAYDAMDLGKKDLDLDKLLFLSRWKTLGEVSKVEVTGEAELSRAFLSMR